MIDMEKKQYTQEEIKNMSYWQLWEIRRQTGLWYYLPIMAVYTFLTYAFIKCLMILATSDTLQFKVDLWIIPVVLLAGPLYYFGHEFYYKNVYLKNNNK